MLLGPVVRVSKKEISRRLQKMHENTSSNEQERLQYEHRSNDNTDEPVLWCSLGTKTPLGPNHTFGFSDSLHVRFADVPSFT